MNLVQPLSTTISEVIDRDALKDGYRISNPMMESIDLTFKEIAQLDQSLREPEKTPDFYAPTVKDLLRRKYAKVLDGNLSDSVTQTRHYHQAMIEKYHKDMKEFHVGNQAKAALVTLAVSEFSRGFISSDILLKTQVEILGPELFVHDDKPCDIYVFGAVLAEDCFMSSPRPERLEIIIADAGVFQSWMDHKSVPIMFGSDYTYGDAVFDLERAVWDKDDDCVGLELIRDDGAPINDSNFPFGIYIAMVNYYLEQLCNADSPESDFHFSQIIDSKPVRTSYIRKISAPSAIRSTGLVVRTH